MSSITCRKITEERGICLKRFWIQTKVPYSAGNMWKKTFISKEDKQASGLKAGMSGLTDGCSVVSDSLWPHGLYSPRNFPGLNTGVGSLSLLQRIFPTQELNPGLPHCRWILYYQGSLKMSRWEEKQLVPTRGQQMCSRYHVEKALRIGIAAWTGF